MQGEISIQSWKKYRRQIGYTFITPALIVLLSFILYPLLCAFIMSFSTYTFVHPQFDRFVGLKNYTSSFHDKYFWNSLLVTFKFSALVVPLEFCLGLTIALFLNREIKFKNIFYAIVIIPLVMSPVAVGLIWRMFLHPELGIANYLLSMIKLPPVNWLGSPKVAFFTVIMVDIWHQVSFMILLLLSGLMSLPKEPFEAATVDGATRIQQFVYITLPLLEPVIAVALLIRTIFAFRTFDLIYVMTRGGPGVSTDVFSYYIYRATFMGLNLAEASALSYILLIIVMVFVMFLFRIIRRAQ